MPVASAAGQPFGRRVRPGRGGLAYRPVPV